MPYTKLTYDIPFKYVMSQTKDAVTSIVKHLTGKVTNTITFKNTILLPEKYGQKTTIYDLYFEIDDGTLFVFEMQNSLLDSELAQRFQAYESILVHSQLKEGEPYQLKQAYCIVFLNNKSQTNCLVEPYQIRKETDNQLFHNNLFNILLVNMNYIEEIKKVKPLNEFNTFERIVYALYYNLSYDILELEDEVILHMEENRQTFLSNEGGFLTMAERQWLDEFERRSREKRYKEELETAMNKVNELEDRLLNERETFIQLIMEDKGLSRQQALLYIQRKPVSNPLITKVKNMISRLHIF